MFFDAECVTFFKKLCLGILGFASTQEERDLQGSQQGALGQVPSIWGQSNGRNGQGVCQERGGLQQYRLQLHLQSQSDSGRPQKEQSWNNSDCCFISILNQFSIHSAVSKRVKVRASPWWRLLLSWNRDHQATTKGPDPQLTPLAAKPTTQRATALTAILIRLKFIPFLISFSWFFNVLTSFFLYFFFLSIFLLSFSSQ